MCGLQLEIEGERVVSVKGDPDDPLSRGHICPKGPALVGLHEDPDRLRQPQRKTATGWKSIGWDEALDEAATRLHAVQEKHGRHAVAAYIGNPAVHNLGTVLYAPSLLRTLGSRFRYSATSVDQLPQMLASYLMFGHQLLLPVPDIDRTEHMVILGANPLVSNGSIMSSPDIKRRLKDIQDRGGRVTVIDPRRTKTAELADRHLFVRPGSDAWLLLSMLHVVFEQDRVELRHLEGVLKNMGPLRAAVEPFSPERAAGPTGIDAPAIRRLVADFMAAPRAVLYARVGVSMHPFGGLCHWLVNCFNLLTGNFDTEGGSMFATPAFDIVGSAKALGIGGGSFGRWHSKVRGLPEFGGELPVATLAEDLERDDEDPIRGFVTIAGNPVLSTPNGRRLETAFEGLEFMLSIDFYINETTRHADLILPPSGPLEHSHFDVVFHALAVRNTAKYSPPAFDITQDQRHDHQIIAGIERRLLEARGAPRRAQAAVWARERLGPEAIVEFGFRVGPRGFGGGLRKGLRGLSMSRLRREPHGVDLGPLQPCMPARLPARRGGATPHIDLAPEPMLEDLARLEASEHDLTNHQLQLIGRRQLRSNNSWMHNVPKLISGKPRCTLRMHAEDANRLGIRDGQDVEITSRVGTITAPVELGDELMPGVVSLPHGFGHHRPGTRLRVATERAGVSINDLTDDQRTDGLSGVAAFSGVPVTVTPSRPE